MLKLLSDSPCTVTEYNVRDTRTLAGGFLNGKVCVWDTRAGGKPQLITEKEISHQESINSLLWIHSKSNSEFFSGSADGQLFWWDARTLQKPIDSLLLDPVRTDNQEQFRCYGCSVLEFEYTIPTKYTIGTEEGYVFFGNRKGATPTEKLAFKIKCLDGPIRSLERNPIFVKNFLAVGEYCIKIWSDDNRDNPIIWTLDNYWDITCATWSHTRSSLLFAGRLDGVLDCWDVLLDQKKPVVSFKVTISRICNVKSHDSGEFAAVADTDGNVSLVGVSPNLWSCSKTEKTALSAIFEREAKRDKLLEGRTREIKLKEKQLEEEAEPVARKSVGIPVDTVVEDTEKKQFQKLLRKERRKRMK